MGRLYLAASFFATLSTFVAADAAKNSASSFTVYSPELCSGILEETYGALQGWSPSEPELTSMCQQIVVSSMKKADTEAAATPACQMFVAQVKPFYKSKAELNKPLVDLKASWCNFSNKPTAAVESSSANVITVEENEPGLENGVINAAQAGVQSTRSLLRNMEKEEVMQTVVPSVNDMWALREKALKEGEKIDNFRGNSDSVSLKRRNKKKPSRNQKLAARKTGFEDADLVDDEDSTTDESSKSAVVGDIMEDSTATKKIKSLHQRRMRHHKKSLHHGKFKIMDESISAKELKVSTNLRGKTKFLRSGQKKNRQGSLSIENTENSSYESNEDLGDEDLENSNVKNTENNEIDDVSADTDSNGENADDDSAIKMNVPEKDSEKIHPKGLYSMTKKFFSQVIEFIVS